MWFMNWIVDRLNAVSGFFYELYYDCYYVGWPLDVVGYWCYYLADAFSDLAWDFSDFGTWVNDVAAKVADMLSWTTVWSNIVSIIPNLETIRDWFYSWWLNVYGVVTDWWAATSWTVQAWIDQAGENIMLLVNQVEASLVDLRASWDDFWTITWPAMLLDLGSLRSAWENFLASTLPDLATWSGVGDLVESTLRSWFPFYDDLIALWGDIKAFFTDPEDWLYKSVDRIVERFW